MSQQYFKTWFFSFLFSSLVLAEWNPKDFLKREHSLIKPFTGKTIILPRPKHDQTFVKDLDLESQTGISLAAQW